MTSWIIIERETGRAVMETWNRKTADAINAKKYAALPAREYLGGLNQFATYAAARAALPADAFWSCSFGYPADEAYCEYWHATGRKYQIRKGLDGYTVRDVGP